MKITAITTALAAAITTSGAAVIIGAPIAAAEDTTTGTLGSQVKLVDGAVIQGWTISDLKASTDVIPYPVAGTLWEATATDEALQGSATPIVSNLNARARNGQTYRVLFGAATPQGVNPATLAQGQKTTGKVYFDVTGEGPDSVVYNVGGQDLLLWVQPPPSVPRTGPRSTPYQATSPAPSASATTTPAPAPAAAEATAPPTTTAVTPPPAGSQGTPLPAGSQGTQLPAGSQGTPLPPGSQALPPGSEAVPGSEVTPVPVAPEGAPRPASVEESPVPAPDGSHGTPITPVTTTPVPAP
ncbi:MPT63 family protein [Mycobacterium sp.]|uniref:MPT63 family protein n=1 Tax=Mycobacterium sp. TaxID=1785 RepID=UPI002DA2160D|nr:MPT63 family protein [Mycobacterium sp.]